MPIYCKWTNHMILDNKWHICLTINITKQVMKIPEAVYFVKCFFDKWGKTILSITMNWSPVIIGWCSYRIGCKTSHDFYGCWFHIPLTWCHALILLCMHIMDPIMTTQCRCIFSWMLVKGRFKHFYGSRFHQKFEREYFTYKCFSYQIIVPQLSIYHIENVSSSFN